MRALGLKVGQLPQIVNIEKLEDMQEYVGGWIDMVCLKHCKGYTIDAVINDEGKLIHLPLNRFWLNENFEPIDIFAGDFLIVANDSEGEQIDLPMKDLIEYAKIYLVDAEIVGQLEEE